MPVTKTIDFSKPLLPAGVDQVAGSWNPGNRTPDLTGYYPGQPAVSELCFAASDGVADSVYYVDKGLVLQFRGIAPGQHWGIFFKRPDDYKLYQVHVVVNLDLFLVQDQAPPLTTGSISSIGAVGTSADVANGRLAPHGNDTNLDIGGTCAFSFNPPDPDQRMRLNAPPPLFQNQPQKAVKKHFTFLSPNLPHPTPAPIPFAGREPNNNSIFPIILHTHSFVFHDIAFVDMYLSQNGVDPIREAIIGGISAGYAGEFDLLQYAGAVLNLDDTPDYNLGPIMVRITRLEVEFIDVLAVC